MSEMKNAIESICSKGEQIEDRRSESEDRNFEMTLLEENKEKKWKEQRESTWSMGFLSKNKYKNNLDSRCAIEGEGNRKFSWRNNSKELSKPGERIGYPI